MTNDESTPLGVAAGVVAGVEVGVTLATVRLSPVHSAPPVQFLKQVFRHRKK